MPIRNAWPRLQKPPLGTPLDPGAPLSRGLVWFAPLWEAGGTTCCDLVSGTNPALVSGTPWTWSGSPWLGCGLGLTSSTYGASATVPGYFGGASSTPVNLNNPITFVLGVRWNGTNPSGIAPIFGYSESNSSDMAVKQLRLATTSGGVMVHYASSNTSVVANLAANVDTVLVVTLTAANGTATGWVNGVQGSTSGAVTSASVGSTTQIGFGRLTGGTTTGACNCTVCFGAIYNRALSAGEIAAWSANPWGIFAPPLPLPALIQTAGLRVARVPVWRDGSETRRYYYWAD